MFDCNKPKLDLSTLGPEIKIAYEQQPDTNAFTDADKAKLDGITEHTEQTDSGHLTASSMVLCILNHEPAGLVQVCINGLVLDPATDYTVDGQTVTATAALNVSYGGTGTDGLGFASTDVFTATYSY